MIFINNKHAKDLEKRRTKHKNNSIFAVFFANMGCLTMIIGVVVVSIIAFNTLFNYGNDNYQKALDDRQTFQSIFQKQQNSMSIEELVQESENIRKQQKSANCFVKGDKNTHLFYVPEQKEFYSLNKDDTVCFMNTTEAMEYGYQNSK